MNLTYVKDYLKTRRDNISVEDIDSLINEIDVYQGTENNFTDISKVMRTINEYNITFLTKVEEYEALPKNKSKLIPQRMEKVRDILCTLSLLHTYLVLSTANIKDSTFNMKNISNYLRDLNDRKEHFKSEKMTWGAILRSLTQESVFITDMRKLDIEDQIGYYKE